MLQNGTKADPVMALYAKINYLQSILKEQPFGASTTLKLSSASVYELTHGIDFNGRPYFRRSEQSARTGDIILLDCVVRPIDDDTWEMTITRPLCGLDYI